MEKADIREIRKVVKSKETVIDWIYGVYVNSDNEVVWENVDRFTDLDEAERFRYMNIFGKILSPNIGKSAFPILLRDQESSLLELRKEKKQVEDFAAFRDQLLESHVHTDPYYATLSRIIYDVPMKTRDKQKLDDSEYVYEALLFCLSPAKLSTPSLGLKDDKVTELDRRWRIGNPRCGFLYPAFDNRMEDRNEALIYSNEPENEAFLNQLFPSADGVQAIGAKDQKEIFEDLLTNIGVTIEDAAAIKEALVEHSKDEETPDQLDLRDVKKIAESCGVKTDGIESIYEETVGDAKLTVDAVVEKNAIVKTDNAVLKMSVEAAQSLRVRNIDGISYIMIPVSGQVTVGNTLISGKQILKENQVAEESLLDEDSREATDVPFSEEEVK